MPMRNLDTIIKDFSYAIPIKREYSLFIQKSNAFSAQRQRV